MYVANITGMGTYGWGNTPAEARAKLAELLARPNAEKFNPGRYA
jgi:hypothetical protein